MGLMEQHSRAMAGDGNDMKCGVAREQSPIEQAIERLASEIVHAEKNVHILSSRLEPIKGGHGVLAGGDNSKQVPDSCALESRLNDLASQLRSTNDSTRALTGSLCI